MNRERQKHMYCAFVCEPVDEIYGPKCVCPGTCEVVCGRREGKLIKPMITLMRSQGVKPETAFHFLSHSIPFSPASIHLSSTLMPILFSCFSTVMPNSPPLVHTVWSFSVQEYERFVVLKVTDDVCVFCAHTCSVGL